MTLCFVTGTDTGVGKTALTAWCLAAARRSGHNWAAMKPVQTGAVRARNNGLCGDLARVARAAGWRPSEEEVPWCQPYVFATPCSPQRAAALERTRIDWERLRMAVEQLRRRYEVVLVEGAGGLRVPIVGRRTMLELAQELAAPVLVAARPGLGTLNHTLLTVERLWDCGLTVLGVVLVASQPGRWTPLMSDNEATLRRFGVPVLGRLPYAPSWPRSPRRAVRFWASHPGTRWVQKVLHELSHKSAGSPRQ